MRPGRWAPTGTARIPFDYYQGTAHDTAGDVFFDGPALGLYRTDARLKEQARNPEAIPPDVAASEDYNHMGDISWDAGEGGRLLLPLECFHLERGPGDPNTCHTGAIGVADPATLQWRYYVKLDPAEIPKATWCEVSPDGQLLWTSAGNDLLAYRTSDISVANAAPAAAPIHSVRQLAGAAPPNGITGGTFVGGQLLVADGNSQVSAIDLGSGTRTLELAKPVPSGESEGLDFLPAAPGSRDGVLRWMFQYPGGRPGGSKVPGGDLFSFVPRATQARLRVRAARAGSRIKLTVRVSGLLRGRREPLADVRVRAGAASARTDARGVARLALRAPRGGRLTVRASRPGMRTANARVRTA